MSNTLDIAFWVFQHVRAASKTRIEMLR